MTFAFVYRNYLSSFDSTETIINDSSIRIAKNDLLAYESFLSQSLDNCDSIAILLPRGARYVAFYTSILNSHMAVLPLNTDWNISYINYILDDCEPEVVLTDKAMYEQHFSHWSLIDKTNETESVYILRRSDEKKFLQICGNNQAYVVYTSGSTGKPKGVVISREAFDAYLDWSINEFNKVTKGYHLITGSINFDIVLADIVIALSTNSPMWITQYSNNIFETSHLLLSKAINSAYFVPSGLQLCMNFLISRGTGTIDKDIRIYCGGEYLSKSLVTVLFKYFTNLKLFNMYGPSEATINCLSGEILLNDLELEILPTGSPMSHFDYYFDNINNPCEPNSSGELILSGIQILTNYTNSSNNMKIISKNGKRYYMTGDYFYTDSSMKMTFSHRVDNEVKIMGNRVNLDLLRDYCMQNIELLDVVFVYYSKTLICFHIGELDKQEITVVLLRRFPDFCIPKNFVKLRVFPINNNGKIDKMQLVKEHA